ncbi:imidazole glycerol phosphate synthase subunit HisH [[Haemophilus] felis]|nr:imidazole glycerol phosphate synthase subunit HisH [[Haemophilus] felis]
MKNTTIRIINTHCANLSSVKFAFERIGYQAEITDNIEKIKSASRLILPGVGTATAAMKNFSDLGLIDTLCNLTQPVLGICLGMQLMTNYSEEGEIELLKLMSARTEKLPVGNLPLPHMGWNKVHHQQGQPLFADIEQDSYFYFVHSFGVPLNKHTVATCDYGMSFSAVIQHNNFYGVQFHPERSGKMGALLLKNFVEKC